MKGLPWALHNWQKFSLRPFLGTQPVGPPEALRFGLPLGSNGAVLPFPFALRFAPFFSTMTRSIASRSGNKVRVDSGTIEWLRLYWFCHDIGAGNSTMATRSASPKGILPFFVVGLGAVLQRREVFDIVIQHSHSRDMLSHSGPLGLAHCLLNVEPLPFGSISTKDRELMQLKTVQEGHPRSRTLSFGHLTIHCSPQAMLVHLAADAIPVRCQTADSSVACMTQRLPCCEPSGLLGASEQSAQSPPCGP